MNMPNQSRNDFNQGVANVVHLAGWLVVGTVQSIPLNTRQAISIRGHIHTHKPSSGDAHPVDTSYPVLFTGQPAMIVMEWAKIRPGRPIRVALNGRLFQKRGECVVLIKYVSVLEVKTGPLDPEAT